MERFEGDGRLATAAVSEPQNAQLPVQMKANVVVVVDTDPSQSSTSNCKVVVGLATFPWLKGVNETPSRAPVISPAETREPGPLMTDHV